MSMLTLSSSRSTRNSLMSIWSGNAGLNKRRTYLLSRVTNQGEWFCFKKGKIEIIDLAYLTAATGDEFALLSGKNEDILFHGNPEHCIFRDTVAEMLDEHKYTIEAHSHPGEDIPTPSKDDRDLLKRIGQKESIIVSATTGVEITFTQNEFDVGGDFIVKL